MLPENSHSNNSDIKKLKNELTVKGEEYSKCKIEITKLQKDVSTSRLTYNYLKQIYQFKSMYLMCFVLKITDGNEIEKTNRFKEESANS